MGTEITGITSLRNDLIDLYKKSRDDNDFNHKKVNALTNAAGKIIGTAKVQMAYQAHVGVTESIPFLES